MYLKTIRTTPPGGWRYVQAESGYAMEANTLYDLAGKVAAHRRNMEYPMGTDIAKEIEEWICDRIPFKDQAEWCDTTSLTPPRTRVHWTMVQSFLQTAGAWLLADRQLVPQEEAERRAAICADCPFNVGMSGCAVCYATLNGLRGSMMHRSTSQDDKLQACGICGCDNKTQAHIPLNVLAKGVPHTYPNFCWKSSLNPRK
jgi:hypothetical protein